MKDPPNIDLLELELRQVDDDSDFEDGENYGILMKVTSYSSIGWLCHTSCICKSLVLCSVHP